ncbi:hypothetical protein DFQ26_004631 [Actinomortierella ambigua]|nr:hypothetical protein DFQ26_004631 [Actinomortierella ambigua]
MPPRWSIDFVMRLLDTSVFHYTFTFVLTPLCKFVGYGPGTLLFNLTLLYAALLFTVRIGMALSTRYQRAGGNGGKRSKIDWAEEVVLITGGASGIGLTLAEALAIRQIEVVVLDVKPVETALGIESYICDVSDPKDIARVAKLIREDVGEPTIIVNNAGIVIGKSIQDLTEQDIRRTMDVNFFSHVWILKEFLPDMLKNDHGHIITISSVMGLMSAPQVADYCASKAAAKAFHESLEAELKYIHNSKGIRTTLVCPGRTATGMFAGVMERFPFWTPVVTPLEVAQAIIHSMEMRMGRNQIRLPFYANFVPLVDIMPAWVKDMATVVSGADRAMDTFQGGAEQEKMRKKDL